MDSVIQIVKLVESHVSNEEEKKVLVDVLTKVLPSVLKSLEKDVGGYFHSCLAKRSKKPIFKKNLIKISMRY